MSAARFKIQNTSRMSLCECISEGNNCTQKRIVDGVYEPGAALCTAVTGGTAIFQPILKHHLVAENELTFPKSLLCLDQCPIVHIDQWWG